MTDSNQLETFFTKQEEPTLSCLMALKEIILSYNQEIIIQWKYKSPFFSYRGKNICYLWKDKKTSFPYIGFLDGYKMDFPSLIRGDRKQVKIMLFDPNNDIPIDDLHAILALCLKINKG